MNSSKLAVTRCRRRQALSGDAAVLICLFVSGVRPGLLRIVGLFGVEIRIDRREANLMVPGCVAVTCQMRMPAAATFLAAAEIAMAQYQGSESRHRTLDIVPSCLHSQQRQQWLPGRRDMLRESSWKACVTMIPEYSDDPHTVMQKCLPCNQG